MHRQLDTKAELELLNKILHSNGIYSAETPTTTTTTPSYVFNAHSLNSGLKQISDQMSSTISIRKDGR